MKPILIFLIIICAINIGFAQDNLVENNLTLYLEGKDVNDFFIDEDSTTWLLTQNEIIHYKNNIIDSFNIDSVVNRKKNNINENSHVRFFKINDAFYFFTLYTPVKLIKFDKNSIYSDSIQVEYENYEFGVVAGIFKDKKSDNFYLYQYNFKKSGDMMAYLYRINNQLKYELIAVDSNIYNIPFFFQYKDTIYYVKADTNNSFNFNKTEKFKIIKNINYNKMYREYSYYIDKNILYMPHSINNDIVRIIKYSLTNDSIYTFKSFLNHQDVAAPYIIDGNKLFFGDDNFFYVKDLCTGSRYPIYVSPDPLILEEYKHRLEITREMVDYSIRSNIIYIKKMIYFDNKFYILSSHDIFVLCNHNFYIINNIK